MVSVRRFRQSGGFEKYQTWAVWPMIVLGLIFLVDLILPLARPLTPREISTLNILNVAIWLIFVCDYIVRLYLSLDRPKFVKTHVLDLIVIAVPFLRPFRLLRLFAIVVSTTRRAGGLAVRQATIYVVFVSVIIASTSAVVVYNFEKDLEGGNIKTLGDAFWWAIATMTTVGYGDATPTTQAGRWIAVLLMLVGVALLGTVTAAVASWFVNIVRSAATADVDEEEISRLVHVEEQLRVLTEEVMGLRAQLLGKSDNSS